MGNWNALPRRLCHLVKNIQMLIRTCKTLFLPSCQCRTLLKSVELRPRRSRYICLSLNVCLFFLVRTRSLSICEISDLVAWFRCQPLFMKLFNTSNIKIIKTCQSYFSFEIPSVKIPKRVHKFIRKFEWWDSRFLRHYFVSLKFIVFILLQ